MKIRFHREISWLILTTFCLSAWTTGCQAGYASANPVRVWQYEAGRFKPAPLESIKGTSKKMRPLIQVDLDQDGLPEEVNLTAGHLAIQPPGLSQPAGQPLWQSPADWQVAQVQVADLNHDGAPEIVLLVWRPFQAWPVDQFLQHGGRIQDFHNAAGYSCHVILIGWKDGSYRERWAGSALAEPLQDFSVIDLNGDGAVDLLALEGDYNDARTSPGRALTAWEWNGFGFTLMARQPGSFGGLEVEWNGSQPLIFTTTSVR